MFCIGNTTYTLCISLTTCTYILSTFIFQRESSTLTTHIFHLKSKLVDITIVKYRQHILLSASPIFPLHIPTSLIYILHSIHK